MKLRQLSPHLWEIPREGGMKVPARFYWPQGTAEALHREQALGQLVGVAHLPGIRAYALAMPDIHWGYGFPIGGVAAVDAEDGAVSPGGVGYDINCGVRLVTTEVAADELNDRLRALVQEIYRSVPVGVGSSAAIPRLDRRELKRLLATGAGWAVQQGFTVAGDDLDRCEEGGCLADADAEAISATALERGADLVGTLGSGNHFLELDRVDELFDEEAARTFGLFAGQLVLQIHSGSRGLGHQVCDDTLAGLTRAMSSFGADYGRIPDRQLACAPITSDVGARYLGAMRAAANFAWANRQVMSALAVRALMHALGVSPRDLGARLLYDVCHNIAKLETHTVDGERTRLLVHRKGATRAFPRGDERIPEAFRAVGQPVLVPGDMGRYSFVLVGRERALSETFGTACHGAGRLLSRHQALAQTRRRRLVDELQQRGIEVMARSTRTLGEEASEAYKDVAEVVTPLVQEGIVGRVARLRPIGVVKG
jgi:tRNA-splicing ligase RtcB